MAETELCIPVAALDQHAVVLGKTGAGKSSALRHVVEHLLRAKKRVVIVDPKGDWWGLKSSADGKGAGFPIITFGDFKEEDATDIPINAQSGKHVAELVSKGNRPAIVGFRGWMTSHMVQFWIDFASTLFRENVGELYLVVDEVHNFAPKGKIMDPQAGKCLHWTNRLMSEGRGLGIVALIASQRPQKVHNDTLTSCETLVAMRVVHAADRSAVEDWIKGCGDAKMGKTVLEGLAQLARGSAYVWSPEIGFGPELLKFPMFETLDSFAPPQLQKKVQRKGWATVDLDAVREKMATVIQEAAANDPKELKKEAATLRSEVATVRAELARWKDEAHGAASAKPPLFGAGDFERLEGFEARFMIMIRDFHGEIEALYVELGKLQEAMNDASEIALEDPKIKARVWPGDLSKVILERAGKSGPPHISIEPKASLASRAGLGNESHAGHVTVLSAEQRILNSLGWWYRAGVQAPTRHMVAFAAKFKVGGYYTNMLGALRTKELISYPKAGSVALTGTGQAMVDPSDEKPTQLDLFRNVLEILPKPQGKIFEALINFNGQISREDLANRAGFSIGGYFTNMLGAMRTAGVIEYPATGMVKLASLFGALP